MGASQIVPPPIDRSRKVLKQQGCSASKALHISPIFAAGVPLCISTQLETHF